MGVILTFTKENMSDESWEWLEECGRKLNEELQRQEKELALFGCCEVGILEAK